MWIEKFGREVVIDTHHPLAAAQRARDSADTADTPPVTVPAATESPGSSALRPEALPETLPRRRQRGR